jgi:DNA-binding CsgD family transcriptional regulator
LAVARESLEALLERLQTTKSIEELQVWAHELRDALGVAHVLYHTGNKKGEQVGAFTYDVDWVRRYIEKDYSQYDPVVLGAIRRFTPMDWKTLDWSSAQARQIMREAYDAGVGNQGWSVPIWGPAGEFAVFTINHNATDEEWKKFISVRAKDILLISHLVHQHAKRIINEEFDSPNTELSPREKETLVQLSQGRNRAEVADNLGISENTLRAYIDSARHKLGAMNVTHAVAMALARGIIVPHGALPKY